MSGRASLLMVAVSSILAGCATLETPAGQSVPADVYNREMSRQGAMYYCGDGTCDRPPMLVRAAAPRYPAAALHAGRAGEASVLFEIDEQGMVSNATLEAATAPEFGEAALQAIRSWKYQPATRDGKPVRIGPVRQTIPFLPK